MTKVLVTRGSLEDIADAIRTKLGVQTTYKPSQFAAAIGSIPTQANLGTKTITQNGTYAATDDNLDGYSSVVANVSGGGGAKNILSGTLAPTANDGSNGDIYIMYAENGVENTSGQYVNTGYSGGDDSKYIIKFMITKSQSSEYPTPFGARPSANSSANSTIIHLAKSIRDYTGAKVGWGSAETVIDFDFSKFYNKPMVIEMSKGVLNVFVDGAYKEFTFNTGSLSDTTNIGIFAVLATDTYQSFSPCDGMIFYSLEIYESGTLVHNFVAAKDQSNVACIHDTVANTYKYVSSGSLTWHDNNTIFATYLKVNGSWVPLVGQDIDDVDMTGQ